MSGQPQDRAQGSTGTQPPEVAQPLVPKGPPKPRFALAVGVVGHRPNRLPSEHTEKDKLDTVVRHVGEVLDAIIAAANQAHADHKTLFNEETPLLSVVSSLAEGADRIVANLAISRKFKLDAPLPFTKDEYEKDFRPRQPKPGETIDPAAEKERSGKLIEELRFLTSPQNARAVLELPGTRKSVDDPDDPDAKRAYEAAGLTVLSQADILLAVWDGGPSEGRGGTSDMVAEAARAGMPIILVDAKGERPPEVRWRNLVPVPAPIVGIEDLPKVSTDKGLHRVIDELVRLPAAAEQRQAFAKWLKERPRRFNHSVGYPLLMSLLRVRRVRREDINPPPPEMLAKQYLEPVVH